MLWKPAISSSILGHLARKKTLPFTFLEMSEYIYIFYRSNDFVSISTKESKHGTLLCGHLGNVSLLIPDSQVYIRFFTRGSYEWGRGDGFKAWYFGLNDKPTGNLMLQDHCGGSVVQWLGRWVCMRLLRVQIPF